MKGIGNGGVVTDGMIFSVDSFNKKSYVPPVAALTQSNVTGSSYSNFAMTRVSDQTQQPIVWSVSGNVQTSWQNDIASNGGSIVLNLSGGAIPESYTVSNAYYDSTNNVTVLYPNTSGTVSMSHSCVNGVVYGYYPAINIPGQELDKIFTTYLNANGGSLVLSLTGGGGNSVVGTSSGSSFSQFPLNGFFPRYAIKVPGNQASMWNSFFNANGTVSVSLSGGATPEVYDVRNSFFDGYNSYTVLYPNLVPSTISMTYSCNSIDATNGTNIVGDNNWVYWLIVN